MGDWDTGVLTNAMHAMLCDSILSKSQWAEELSAAAYVQNRTLTKALGGRTPYKICYRNRTSPIWVQAHLVCLVLLLS